MFCCYIYNDPRQRKLEAIYVGKGNLNRPDVHLKKGSHNKLFNRKLAKIKAAGLIPNIIKISCATEAQAFMLERFWIKTIGRADLGLGSLCNYTDGGEGTCGFRLTTESMMKKVSSMSGFKHSEKTKRLISKNRTAAVTQEFRDLLKNLKSGISKSEDTKSKISNTLKGKTLGILKSEETKNKMSATAFKRSPEHYEKIQASRLKTLAERKSALPKIARKCEACSNTNYGEYGSGRFCCVKCARGFATMVSRNILLKEKEIKSPLSIID